LNKYIEVILFDLGGVLIELGESPFPQEWLTLGQNFKLSDWFKSDTALLFERGQIPSANFANEIKNDLGLQVTTEDIISHFTMWPIGPYPGVSELLQALSQKYTLAILTNTNELHWPRIMDEFELSRYCEHIFASHIINFAKPDIAAFEYVINEMNIAPENVVFFDDNSLNVNAANKMGMHSYAVKGKEELHRKVLELGLL
jgi:glucose-1-phosphatase